ncbi:MAG: hypothetical protein SFV17_11120 [Candidatus Obscuribacter sp.]|nr:hypothetical protein [Candidatus Obscuribacter sp.]
MYKQTVALIQAKPAQAALPVCLRLLAALTCFFVEPAQAQTVVNIKRDQLEQVKPFQARRHFYITDETPRVSDYRRLPEVSPNYAFAVPALAPNNGAGQTIILTPQSNGLPRAVFESNIGAGQKFARALPQVNVGGLSPNPAVRPVGAPAQVGASARALTNIQARPVGKPMASASQVSQYRPYAPGTTGGSVINSQSSTKVSLTGKLIQK